VLIGDFTRGVAILRRLKNLGVASRWTISAPAIRSLSYLQSFPLTRSRSNKAFIANLGHSQQAATIIRAVIALGSG